MLRAGLVDLHWTDGRYRAVSFTGATNTQQNEQEVQ
jgi:hypothetical protein